MYKTLFTFIILLSISWMPAFAGMTSSKSEQLKQITQQIESTQSKLNEVQKSEQDLSHILKQSELEISSTSKNITQLTEKIQPKKKELVLLQKSAAELSKNLASQQKSLAILLNAAYKNNQKTYIKLFLNQENPTEFSRMNQYYHYYSQAEIELMQSIQATLLQLNNTKKKIGIQVNELTQLRNQHVLEQTQLTKSQQERKIVMKQIQGQIKTTQEKLNQLIENKKALENLVARLGRQEFINDTRFELLKNRLPWPVQAGSLIRRFGSKQSAQSLPEQGVLIKAALGQYIYAIAPGKVIYAEWLKGFGLLIILDHGKGYMSLYSHCNSLNNKVGDIVRAGAVIASVGNSGGFQESALAFEIRYNGRPLDPNQWCKGKL